MSGKYIVVFKPTATKDQIDKYANDVNMNGGSVSSRYDSAAMKGFSAMIPDQYLLTLQALQGNIIDYIEPDGTVTTQ